MAVRVALFLSGLTGVLALIWIAYVLIVAPAWYAAALLYAGFFWGVALAAIWLSVFIVHVIAKAIRVMDEAK